VVSRVFAGNRFEIPTGTNVYASPYTSERWHFAPIAGTITNIRCVDFNVYLNADGTITAGAAHNVKRTIEYPAGVFHTVSWGGVATLSKPNAIMKQRADVLQSSVDGKPLSIPAAALFGERTVNLSNGIALPTVVILRPAPSWEFRMGTSLPTKETVGRSTRPLALEPSGHFISRLKLSALMALGPMWLSGIA
jgi:hypothetical protein